jgi:alginate O-acetyltransferase complex protein AlgI
MQIFFDFSGYTDMAIGFARVMGFHFPVNFRQPYLAISITDFWRRWHISLSSWLRDYLYIPLGGNRHGKLATYRNLMLTMLSSIRSTSALPAPNAILIPISCVCRDTVYAMTL